MGDHCCKSSSAKDVSSWRAWHSAFLAIFLSVLPRRTSLDFTVCKTRVDRGVWVNIPLVQQPPSTPPTTKLHTSSLTVPEVQDQGQRHSGRFAGLPCRQEAGSHAAAMPPVGALTSCHLPGCTKDMWVRMRACGIAVVASTGVGRGCVIACPLVCRVKGAGEGKPGVACGGGG